MDSRMNPKFSGLPNSAMNSEVFANRYAEEVNKAGREDDVDEIVRLMEEWEELFRREGISVSNKSLEVFSEVTMVCNKSGQQDLAGRFSGALITTINSIARQFMSASSYMNKMEEALGNLHEGVAELKRTTEGLVKHIPRNKITVKKRINRANPSGSQTDNALEKTVSPSEQPIELDEMTTSKKGKEKERKPNLLNKSEEENMETENGKEEDDSINQHLSNEKKVIEDQIDSMNIKEKKLREYYRDYYSSLEFDALNDDQQEILMDYYIRNILGIKGNYNNDDSLYLMLRDLTNKSRVMVICNDAQEGEIENRSITLAVDEIQESINEYSSPYGGYTAEVIWEGRTPRLFVKKKDQ